MPKRPTTAEEHRLLCEFLDRLSARYQAQIDEANAEVERLAEESRMLREGIETERLAYAELSKSQKESRNG